MIAPARSGGAARRAVHDYVALAAIICLGTYLLIGDFGVRLANTGSDEGVVGYALYFKQPELFRLDAHMLHWGPLALSSMMNWLPGLLFKYLDTPPEYCYWLFVFLQNVLLGFAVFRFARIATGSREVAWLSALFTLAFRPHWWNIALYSDADWMPYANWLALPFLVYAGSLALENRLWATALSLLIGGLIHPVLGLFAAAILGAYWCLLRASEIDTRELALAIAVLGVTTVAFMAPALVTRYGIVEAPANEILVRLLRNGHTIPWNNPDCGYCLPLFVRNSTLTVLMSALGLLAVARLALHARVRHFLHACIAVTCASVLLHLAGYLLGIVSILKLITARSSILLLVHAAPLVVALLWRQFQNAQPLVRLLAGYALVLPSAAALLAALLAVGGVEYARTASGRTARWAVALCQGLGAALFALLLARHVPKLGPRVDLYLLEPLLGSESLVNYFGHQTLQFPGYSVLLAAYLCAMVAWQSLEFHDPSRTTAADTPPLKTAPYAVLLALPIVVYLFMWNQESGRQATSGEAREYYEVQVWARASTAPEASFVVAQASVYEGWRNFTHRPEVPPIFICAVYVCPVAALERDRKLEEFYARSGKPGYIHLDAPALREFARLFGGDYAVRRKEWGMLDLPVAYENASYVVYALY